MKQIDVPVYNDPTSFESENVKYPCSTQYMVYNGLTHRYYLTEEALNRAGIDVERKYIYNGQNKTQHFINTVTEKIYSYINYKAGMVNFQAQVYRIATAPKKIMGDQYTFRKEFESILLSEADWLIDNQDSAKYSSVDMEKGERNGKKPEEEWDDTSDISTTAKRKIHSLGLDKDFTLMPNMMFDYNKF